MRLTLSRIRVDIMADCQPTKPLKKEWLAFAQLVSDGVSKGKAYQQVYKCRPEVARQLGSELAKKPAVSVAISTLTDGVMVAAIMDKYEALQHLTGMARNDGEAASSRISAIKTTAELQDWLSPQKVQVLHLHELLSTSDDTSDDASVRSSWSDEDAIDA